MRRLVPVVLALTAVLVAAWGVPGSSAGPGARPAAGPAAAGPAAAGPAAREASGPVRVEKVDPRRVRGSYVPGEVLVKFRRGVARGRALGLHAALGVRVRERIAGGLGVDVVRLPPGLSVTDAIRRYTATGLVAYAEPNFYRFPAFLPDDTDFDSLWGLHNTAQAHPVFDPPPSTSTGTDDADIDAPAAWDTVKGPASTDPDVVVAVIDSGVDVTHPDLADNIWVNPGEVPANGVDDDGNGYVDDVNGWDTAEDDNTLLEPDDTVLGFDHGTHVAGTIAAVTNNTEGVAGVCGGDAQDATVKGCKIMVLKFMAPEPIGQEEVMVGTLEAELEAIVYARENGAHIINGSYGSSDFSSAERNAFRKAGVANGILSVLAAGNASLDNDMLLSLTTGYASPSYPASYTVPYILSVAASNHHDEYGYFTGCVEDAGRTENECAFTSFGHDSVDVAAPGVDVLSTLPSNTYGTFNGTSMATPHVAGVAALLKASDPALGPLDIKNKIMNSVDTGLPLTDTMFTVLFVTPGGPSERTGSWTRTNGRVNAAAALGAPTDNATPLTDGNVDGARSLKSRQRNRVSWPDDVNDVYRKRLVRGRRYEFVLVVPTGRDFDLFLWDRGAREIWQLSALRRASVGGTGADESFRFRPGSTGTYYVHVSSFFTGGRYTLRFRCVDNC